MRSIYPKAVLLDNPAGADYRNSGGRRIHTAGDTLGLTSLGYLWNVPFPDMEKTLLLFPLGREGWNYRS